VEEGQDEVSGCGTPSEVILREARERSGTSGKTSPDILLKIFCGHQNSDIFGKFCQL
jgi:hypothetical protein